MTTHLLFAACLRCGVRAVPHQIGETPPPFCPSCAADDHPSIHPWWVKTAHDRRVRWGAGTGKGTR